MEDRGFREGKASQGFLAIPHPQALPLSLAGTSSHVTPKKSQHQLVPLELHSSGMDSLFFMSWAITRLMGKI